MVSDKVPDEVLMLVLANCPAEGEVYKHYKTGSTYKVVGAAIAEATQEPLVIYRKVGSVLTFARPVREWDEPVPHEGLMVRRFVAI